MTIIMSIPSVQIGIRRTEADMDIIITRHHNRDKRNVCGVSPEGIAWIFANMGTSLATVIVVDEEGVPDIIEEMKKGGLIVQE
jgi:hypothetical protein